MTLGGLGLFRKHILTEQKNIKYYKTFNEYFSISIILDQNETLLLRKNYELFIFPGEMRAAAFLREVGDCLELHGCADQTEGLVEAMTDLMRTRAAFLGVVSGSFLIWRMIAQH